jgi:hypothetical protein
VISVMLVLGNICDAISVRLVFDNICNARDQGQTHRDNICNAFLKGSF